MVMEPGSARSRAVWEGAVDQLAAGNLIKDVGHSGDVYELTRDCYDLAELLDKRV